MSSLYLKEEMYKILGIISIGVLCTSFYTRVFTSETDAFAALSKSISKTEKILKEQKELLELVERFMQCRERFISSADDKKLAATLVRAAMQLEETLKTSQMKHLFPALFLKEIKFFNEIGQKKLQPQERKIQNMQSTVKR